MTQKIIFHLILLSALFCISACHSPDTSHLVASQDSEAPPTLPAGIVLPFAGENVPDGYLLCDGAELAREDFPRLFDAIGIAHGHGNGDSTFVLPDYRGRFLRGVDHGIGRDPDRQSREAASIGGAKGDTLGSVQSGSTAMPQNVFETKADGEHAHQTQQRSSNELIYYELGAIGLDKLWRGADDTTSGTSGEHQHQVIGGDAETRPMNAGVNWIIKT